MSDNAAGSRGPKVHAERVGTADAGGGQLSIVDQQLMVQGPVRGRVLGPLAELHRIVFEDHRGRRTALHFADGVIWTLSTETEDLMPFMQSLEAQLGRVDMIEKAPTPGQQLQAEMTPELQLHAMQLLAVGIIAGGALVATSHAATLGYLIIVLAFPYLMAAAASRALQPPPQWLWPLNTWTRARGWVLAWAAPVLLLLASAAGVVRAGELAEEAAAQTRIEAAQAQEVARLAAAAAAEEARREVAIAELLGTIQATIDSGQILEAGALIVKAEAITPDSDALATLKQRLAPKLAAAAEVQRGKDVREGLKLARNVVRDPLHCDSANAVSNAWTRVRQVNADDELYDAVNKVLPDLEACRRRVERTFSRGAEEARVQQRLQLASTFENELRHAGHATTIEFNGSRRVDMTIRLDRVDDVVAAAIVSSGQDGKTLLDRAAAIGIRKVRLLDNRKVSRKYPLESTEGVNLGREVLKGFGLDEPLALAVQPR